MRPPDRHLRVFMAEFSGTGNTRYLGAVLEHALEAEGHDVARVAMRAKPRRSDATDCELVFIGSPVYHAAPPENVVHYLRQLTGQGRPLVTYLSKGLYSGDCARILHAHAAAAGFRPIANFEASFPGSDLVALTREDHLLVRLNRRITEDLLEKARRFVNELKPASHARSPRRKWYAPLNDLASRAGRPAYERYKKQLRANPEACTQGYWCVANCPVHAIRPNEGAVTFDPDACVFCLRCYHRCPHDAIRIGDAAHGTYPGPQIARHYEAVAAYQPERVQCEPRARAVNTHR